MTVPNFTPIQIIRIFEAGIRRGEDVATAYEWGSRVSGGKYDEMIDEIQDIVNGNRSVTDDNWIDQDTIRSWFPGCF